MKDLREKLLATRGKIPIEPPAIEGWPAEVRVRAISGARRDFWRLLQLRYAEMTRAERMQHDIGRDLVLYCICDEQGRELFEIDENGKLPDDAHDWIAGIDAPGVDELVKQIARLSNFLEEAEEDELKNSASGRGGSSSSASAAPSESSIPTSSLTS